jgi:glycosyltransferase involved in cell wall biosynthesis
MQSLSIVIPAYNETASIRAGKLGRVSEWRADQAFTTEIIVVDDGSEDDTARLARGIADHVLTISHAGKASAIATGIEAAHGDVILVMDMDQATPITEAAKLFKILEQRGGVVIGSRGLARQGAPLGRYLLSWGQVVLRRLLLGLNIADTQCGFKAFPCPVAREVLNKLRVYHPAKLKTIRGPSVTSGFDVEFLFVARRLGYSIQEVPVEWNYKDTRRVNLLKDAWRGIKDLLAILTANLRGSYPKPRSLPARHIA